MYNAKKKYFNLHRTEHGSSNSHALDTNELKPILFLTALHRALFISSHHYDFPCKTTANVEVVVLSRLQYIYLAQYLEVCHS
jgi:hypothetical protein